MKLQDFKRGWILGKFEPSLAQTNYEVGLRWNNAGEQEDRHYHRGITEYVAFAGGKHRLGDREYVDGDVLVIHPYMSTDYECLEPGYCLTVKDKSIPGDKYVGSPITVAIPMAGKGVRFRDAGYYVPKPMIPLAGKPMINRVVENFTPNADHHFILVTRNDIRPEVSCVQVPLDHDTQGTVSTMFEIEDQIGREDPLMIVNCDQLIPGFEADDFMSKAADCSVVVTKHDSPKHSYVKEENGLVTEVAEKVVISDKAVAGIYFYRKAKYFFDNAHQMVEKNIRVNNEFYTTPVFNEIIASGLTVNTYEINNWQPIGTPSELMDFQLKLKNGEATL